MAARHHTPSSINLQLAQDISHSTFADYGDSGAWVLNSMGNLVGLLSGESYRHASSNGIVTYMMPFEAIRVDIMDHLNNVVGTASSFEMDWPKANI
jgi:hypothetical protein